VALQGLPASVFEGCRQIGRGVMSISRTTTKLPSTRLLATGFFRHLLPGLALPALPAAAQAQKASVRYEEKKRQTNDIAVSIITSGLTCTCAGLPKTSAML